jgi:hypothetical protein
LNGDADLGRTQEGCSTTGAVQALSAGTDELSDSGNPPQAPPLDVMVFTMNAFMAAADILGSRILEINEQMITRLSLLERAARIAKDAAPYVHPRLVRMEHTGNDLKPVNAKATGASLLGCNAQPVAVTGHGRF